MAVAFGILVAVLAVLIYAAWKRTEINALGGCPVCHSEMPAYRRPSSFRQAVWGGWTCENCGSELDRRGREIEAEHREPIRLAANLLRAPANPEAQRLSPRVRSIGFRVIVPLSDDLDRNSRL